MASKKQGTRASADSANDAVPVDETVRVPQNLINGKEFKGIELRIVTTLSWRWRRQLIKPSELALVIVKFGLQNYFLFEQDKYKEYYKCQNEIASKNLINLRFRYRVKPYKFCSYLSIFLFSNKKEVNQDKKN
jgi:hypothetical protein